MTTEERDGVSSVDGLCIPAETGASGSAAWRVSRPATGHDKWHRPNVRYGDMVTQHGAPELACGQCGRLFTARRRWARYCGNRCRQAAFQARRRAMRVQ